MGRHRKHPAPDVAKVEYDYGTGYVYAAELSDGTVKIGFTRSPRNRMATLGVFARHHFGANVEKFACTRGIGASDARIAERIALRRYRAEFEQAGVRRHSEFFRLADFELACAFIGAMDQSQEAA